MIKVAVKVGHTELAKGAYSPTIEEAEYNYNLKVAKELEKLSDDKVQYVVFTFNPRVNSYTQRQKYVADVINKDEDFKFVIELHYDMAESHTAKGTTVLYYGNSTKGREAAKLIGDVISEDCGTHRRSDIPLKSSTQNGYQAVVTPKPVAILIEPFFGSNPQDALPFKGTEGRIKYARSLNRGVRKYLKV